MNRSVVLVGIVAAIIVAGVSRTVVAQVGSDRQLKKTSDTGLKIAHQYLQGLEKGELAELDGLFLSGERSSIFENASDEGSWEHYRDHHLAPEMKATSGFKVTVAKEEQDNFGSTVVVRQVGKFGMKVGEEDRTYRVAITYVLIEDAGDLKIAHLHWSSRAERAR